MLDMEPGWISPIVEDLAAVKTPANAPPMLVALVEHEHVPHADIVEITAFKGHMIEACLSAADDRQKVKSTNRSRSRPLVEVQERSRDMRFIPLMDQFGRLHPKNSAIPGDELLGVCRENGRVAEDAAHAKRHSQGAGKRPRRFLAKASFQTIGAPSDRTGGRAARRRAQTPRALPVRIAAHDDQAAAKVRAIINL